MTNAFQKISRARLFDLLWSMPLIVCYGVSLLVICKKLLAANEPLYMRHLMPSYTAGFLVQILTISYTCLSIVFLATRRLPVAKAKGLKEKFIAVISSNSGIVLVLLPQAPPNLFVEIISFIMVAAGLAGALCVLSYLGRSFCILPQARGLVTKGPYRFVRHPLYLTGMVSFLGISLQFLQPWSMLITILSFALQLMRMKYEEQTLARYYPEYKEYSTKTSRLVPAIY